MEQILSKITNVLLPMLTAPDGRTYPTYFLSSVWIDMYYETDYDILENLIKDFGSEDMDVEDCLQTLNKLYRALKKYDTIGVEQPKFGWQL